MTTLKLSEDLRPVSDLQGYAAIGGDLQRAVDDAERDLAEGRWVENAEVTGMLQRWAAGEA